MKIPTLLLTFCAASAAGLCQGPSTTITLSEGLPCNSSAHPVFTVSTMESTISMIAAGGGSPSGRLQFSDIAVTKRYDNCSVSVYNLLFLSKHLASAVISQRNATNQETLRITLTSAMITSIAETAGPGEKISFTYDRIEVLDPVTGTRTGFDRSTNKGF